MAGRSKGRLALTACMIAAFLSAAWVAAGTILQRRGLEEWRADYESARWAHLWPGGAGIEARAFSDRYEALHDAGPITALYHWHLAKEARNALPKHAPDAPHAQGD